MESKVILRSFPRIVFCWPLLLILSVFAVICSTTDWLPSSTAGIVLYTFGAVSVVVYMFNYPQWPQVGGLLVAVSVISSILLFFGLMPPTEWFVIRGEYVLLVAAFVLVVLCFKIVLNYRGVTFTLGAQGVSINSRGQTYMLQEPIQAVENDKLESLFGCACLVPVGTVTIPTPYGVMTLEGVFDAVYKAEEINAHFRLHSQKPHH